MVKCSVLRCTTRRLNFRFPEDEKLLRKWLHAMKRDAFVPSNYSRVCIEHFKPDDFTDFKRPGGITALKKVLKKDAVPSVFRWTKPLSKEAKEQMEQIKKRCGHVSAVVCTSTRVVSVMPAQMGDDQETSQTPILQVRHQYTLHDTIKLNTRTKRIGYDKYGKDVDKSSGKFQEICCVPDFLPIAKNVQLNDDLNIAEDMKDEKVDKCDDELQNNRASAAPPPNLS